MAATCEFRVTTISDLPLEVLSHIFSYLPYNLRVIRLVCSKWNESCNVEKVSGDEKIVIGGQRLVGRNQGGWQNARIAHRETTTTSADEFFSNKTLTRNIYNLHLELVSFKTDYVAFFKKFGGKLRSLSLKECDADEYIPFDTPILQFCKNLNTLILDKCPRTIVQLFRSSDGRFVQTSIKSLTIERFPRNKHHTKWSDETVDACFRICPHLRSLTLKSFPANCFSSTNNRFYSFKDSEERVFNRSDIRSFDCIYYALSIRAANMVELNLHEVDGILPEQIERIASIPGLKLRKLEIYFHQGLTLSNIQNIVESQPDLRNITIRRCGRILLNDSVDWIEKCSKLTRLEINTLDDEEFIFDEELRNALTARSHLRELVLKTCGIPFIHSDFENSRGTFDHLHTLKLKLPYIDYNCVLEKVSVNLNHLSVEDVYEIPNKTLELISNRFTNLETLELFRADGPSWPEYYEEEEDFSERTSCWNFESISVCFMELKTLKIDIRCGMPGGPKPPRRFKAPKLQYLELNGFDEIDATSLRGMVENYPSLKCLVLYCSTFYMKLSDLRIAFDWKGLNRFYINNTELLQLHRRGENEDETDLSPRSGSFYRKHHWRFIDIEDEETTMTSVNETVGLRKNIVYNTL